MSGKSSEGASPSSSGASVPRAASSLIQPRQTKRGAQFEAPCLLFPRDLDGGLEGLFSWCWIGRFTHRQDFTFHAAQSGSKRILPCVFDINEPCSDARKSVFKTSACGLGLSQVSLSELHKRKSSLLAHQLYALAQSLDACCLISSAPARPSLRSGAPCLLEGHSMFPTQLQRSF